jgi:hypothetical protein
MGLTPATGTEIAISCVYDAFGFPLPTFNISLNGILGFYREPPQALGVSSIPASSQTSLSADMGGLTTIDEYNCDTFTALSLGTSNGVNGFESDTNFCTGTTTNRIVFVQQAGITSFQEAAITYGLPLYSATTFINANKYNGGDQWYGSPSKSEVFQVGTDGAMSVFGVCVSPTPTPTNTPTPPVTPSNTPTPPVTPSNTPTPPVTPTNTPTPSVTPPLYYTLNGCTGQPLYDTTITPVLASQRYVDPGDGTFWTWDNAAGTSSPQQTVNASLQIVSGQSGCP